MKRTYGYVDDRLRRLAALPPLPERGKRKMLAFAHIPTGTTTNKGLDIDDSKNRTVTPASVLTALGADLKTRGATP
jgi:hypothetical protein